MAGFGWKTQRILAHLDDAPDFYLDQVAQVVMDSWSSGRVGLSGTRRSARRRCPARAPGWPWSAPTCWPGAAAADWDPAVGFAGYQERCRLRRGQPGDRSDARADAHGSRAADPDAEPGPEPHMEAFTDLIDRAVNGPELPEYEGVRDSR